MAGSFHSGAPAPGGQREGRRCAQREYARRAARCARGFQAPRALRIHSEVLIQVRAARVGNWDEFGELDTGIRPPMALGVTAAGCHRGRGRSGQLADRPR